MLGHLDLVVPTVTHLLGASLLMVDVSLTDYSSSGTVMAMMSQRCTEPSLLTSLRCGYSWSPGGSTMCGGCMGFVLYLCVCVCDHVLHITYLLQTWEYSGDTGDT